jgi:hypothetical protein
MRLTSFLYEKIYGYTKIHNLLNWLGVIGGKKSQNLGNSNRGFQ